MREFPRTTRVPFIQTSDATPKYNCIAWAANDQSKWYWPDPDGIYYWPRNIKRVETVQALIQLYESLGYSKCSDGTFEEGFVKIAVFAAKGVPKHAARQLDKTWWTSKLGRNIDVSHSIYSMEGGDYGNVVQYLKKKSV